MISSRWNDGRGIERVYADGAVFTSTVGCFLATSASGSRAGEPLLPGGADPVDVERLARSVVETDEVDEDGRMGGSAFSAQDGEFTLEGDTRCARKTGCESCSTTDPPR